MGNTFNNPSEDLDFSFIVEPLDKIKEEEKKDESLPLDIPDSLSIDPPKEEEVKEELSLVEEEKEEEEVNQNQNQYLNLINKLADLNLATELPEDIDKDADPTEETLLKFIEHNFKKKEDEVVQEFYSNLSPLAQRVVQFDLNVEADLLQPYLRTLSEELEIKNLDPTNEYDQEQIVRSWYRQDEWTQEEIEEKVKELKDTATLQKEANRLKPKLDNKAEAIAKEQEKTQALLKQVENKRKSDYYQKVETQISKGEVGGIKLSKELAQDLFFTLIEDDVPMRLPEGKQIKMPYLEALIFQHKYHPEGNIENLALAALLLRNPKAFKEAYAKVVQTEVTEEFTRAHKYNNSIKVAGDQKLQSKKQPEKQVAWNLKLK